MQRSPVNSMWFRALLVAFVLGIVACRRGSGPRDFVLTASGDPPENAPIPMPVEGTLVLTATALRKGPGSFTRDSTIWVRDVTALSSDSSIATLRLLPHGVEVRGLRSGDAWIRVSGSVEGTVREHAVQVRVTDVVDAQLSLANDTDAAPFVRGATYAATAQPVGAGSVALFFFDYAPRSPNGANFWRASGGPAQGAGPSAATIDLRPAETKAELPRGSMVPPRELVTESFTDLLGSFDQGTSTLRLDPAHGSTRLRKPLYPHLTTSTRGDCKADTKESDPATPWDLRVRGKGGCNVQVTVKLVFAGSVTAQFRVTPSAD